MKKTNSDLVALAEASLASAQAAVSENRKTRATLAEEAGRLWEEIGRDGDDPAAERKANRHRVIEARLARLDQDLPGLERLAREGAAAVTTARAEAAQKEVDRLGLEMERLNREIADLAAQLTKAIERHAALEGEGDALAAAHHLPTPPRHRWLLGALVRSSGAKRLRDRLDQAHSIGLGGSQPAALSE